MQRHPTRFPYISLLEFGGSGVSTALIFRALYELVIPTDIPSTFHYLILDQAYKLFGGCCVEYVPHM